MFLLWSLLNLNAKKSLDHKVLTTRVEKKYDIPGGLLYAIMQVESRGHPLAVYSKQKGHRRKSVRFKTVHEAVEYVTLLQALGAKNINVGCMQINLKCHTNTDMALWFSPEYNIEYAAQFLSMLKKRMGSWKSAVAFYHSGSKEMFHETYLNKVNRYFNGGNLWDM